MKVESPLPLYRQVADKIASWVDSGRLKPGWQLVSERTMSEVLNLSRRTIRTALQDLVKRGYVSVTHGCGNFVNEPPVKRPVRILVLEKFSLELASFTPQYHDQLHQAEKQSNVSVHYKYVPTVESLREILASPPSGYDGMFIYRPPQDWLNELLGEHKAQIQEKLAVPLLISYRVLRGSGYHFVSPDHFGQTYAAARKLIALGHRRIGYISGMLSQDFMWEARNGYLKALQENGITPLEEDQFFMESFNIAENERLIGDFIRKRQWTAVIVTGSAFSVPFENAVQRAAIHVPSELSAILITERKMLDTLALRWSANLYPENIIARCMELFSQIVVPSADTVVEELIPHEEVPGATCQRVSG